MRYSIKKATNEKVEELKKELKELLGITVYVRILTGSMKHYYHVHSGKKNGYKFNEVQAKMLKDWMIENKVYTVSGPVNETDHDFMFQSNINFCFATKQVKINSEGNKI